MTLLKRIMWPRAGEEVTILQNGKVFVEGHVIYSGDDSITILVHATPASRKDGRACSLNYRQRAAGTKTVSYGINGDGGNSIVRQCGSYHERAVVLVVAEAVAEDRYRPAIRGTSAGRDKQIEVQIVRALDSRHAGARGHSRNEGARSLKVHCREFAKRHRAH